MKIWLTLMAAAVVLFFGGCAAKTAPEKDTAEPSGENVSAYYYAAYADASAVEENLKSAGFEIVATYAAAKNSETVVITNEALKAASDKPGLGFAAILRVLIDGTNQRVAVTNPVYFGKAFMQSAYDHRLGTALTEALAAALGTLTPSEDGMEYDSIASYHFMVGMPYYRDVFVLGEGNNTALLSKLEHYNDGNNVVFRLDVGEGRTLVGFDLDKRTKKFVGKIGLQNAEILPYTILVEDGRATALAAKYYIAISYPMLTMGDFMHIATVPGSVEKELAKPFK